MFAEIKSTGLTLSVDESKAAPAGEIFKWPACMVLDIDPYKSTSIPLGRKSNV
jgi:hypothetical protein